MRFQDAQSNLWDAVQQNSSRVKKFFRKAANVENAARRCGGLLKRKRISPKITSSMTHAMWMPAKDSFLGRPKERRSLPPPPPPDAPTRPPKIEELGGIRELEIHVTHAPVFDL